MSMTIIQSNHCCPWNNNLSRTCPPHLAFMSIASFPTNTSESKPSLTVNLGISLPCCKAARCTKRKNVRECHWIMLWTRKLQWEKSFKASQQVLILSKSDNHQSPGEYISLRRVHTPNFNISCIWKKGKARHHNTSSLYIFPSMNSMKTTFIETFCQKHDVLSIYFYSWNTSTSINPF